MKRLFSGIVVLTLVVSLFGACSRGYVPEAPPPDPAPGNYTPEEPYMSPLPLLTPSNSDGKKMIYTVDLRLQTTAFEEGTRNLLVVVEEMGGYIVSAHINGRSLYEPHVDRLANYTFAIPSENLAAFLAGMERNYNLWQLTQEAKDVTAQYEQTDTRIADLQAQEGRLIDRLKTTTDMEEGLALEQELFTVQEELGRLSASKSGMEGSVIYSTVNIQLYEVNPNNIAEPTVDSFGVQVSQTANGSLRGFVAFWQGFVLFVITVLPIAIVLFVFAATALWIRRMWLGQNEKTAAAISKKLADADSDAEAKKATETSLDSDRDSSEK